jgi:Tfp pilus assembly protein PilF
LLGRLPPGTAGSELLSAMIDGQGLPDSAASADLQGLSAVDLGIRGLCLLRDSVRQPFTQRGARNVQALHCFTEAILRAPLARPLYYEQRAFTAQLASDAAAARSAAAALQLLWPDSPRALYAAGRALQTFDNPAARRLLERSIALDPRQIDAYNLLAVTCCNSGDPEAAESCCWRALALDPDSANMLYWLGESLARRNCADEACVALRAALARQPLAAGWAQLGLLVLISGDPASARCMYARSLELDPGQGRVRVFYGAALELAGDPASGRAELQQGLAEIFPQDAAFWRTTSAVFSYVQAPQASLLAAEAGLALAPADAELASLRARAAQQLDH